MQRILEDSDTVAVKWSMASGY